ncbi:MAG: ABC transporter substrate-binding protein [Natronosporangium sp.]
MRRHPRILTALAVAATMLVASACTGGDGETNGEDSAPDDVVYITAFGTLGREAYVWVAEEKGYFEEANINVEIQPGTGTGDNVALVASGQAQFATGDLSGVTLLIGNGDIEGITVVGAVHQLSLIGILSLASSEIQTPQDLEGKSIADSGGSVGRLLWPTYANLVGIDPDSVELVTADPPQLPTLLASGEVDAIGQFAVGVPLIQAAAEGQTASFIAYSDEMTDLYGNSLVTSTELAQSDPDLVQRFRDALFRGLEYSIDNPQEAGEILAAADESVNPEVAAAELEIMEAYVRQAGVPIGSVDEVRVSQTIALLESTNAIPAGLTSDQVMTPSLIISG